MEQTNFLLPQGEPDLLRRIRLLAERAERTAHNRSNFVGPPPSQEHLDILAEIRKLTDEMTVAAQSLAAQSLAAQSLAAQSPSAAANARRAGTLPRPARPADDLVVPGKI